MWKRHAESQLHAALADTPVVVLHGPRQSGKSTLARSLCGGRDGREYITLDDVTSLAAAADAPSFLRDHAGPIVIDEVQRMPGLFLTMKLAVDERRTPGRFLLTGSSNVMMLPQMSDALVGRVQVIPLWPLSQGEIGGHVEGFIDGVFAARLPAFAKPSRSVPLRQRILRGGYPEALTRTEDDRRADWFAAYISTILDRGVRDLANIEGLAEMPSLLTLIATRTTGLLNSSDLSRGLSLPLTTLKRYLALLQATFLIVAVPAWASNRGLRLTKSPKIILADTGLACHLDRLDAERFAEDGNARGRMVENFVAMELIKQAAWSRARPTVYHYRTTNGSEVDLVLEQRGGRVVGVEVKSSAKVDRSDFRGLHSLAEAAGEKFVRGIVLYDGDQVVPFGTNMAAVPISALWTM